MGKNMKESILFDFATLKDLESCKQIVAQKLQANQVDCDDLDDLTRDIMKLSYSIGGSYDANMIVSVTQCYLDHPQLSKKVKKRNIA